MSEERRKEIEEILAPIAVEISIWPMVDKLEALMEKAFKDGQSHCGCWE